MAKVKGLEGKAPAYWDWTKPYIGKKPSRWQQIKLYFVSRYAMNREFASAHKVALDLYYEAEHYRVENAKLKKANKDAKRYYEVLSDNEKLKSELKELTRDHDHWKKEYEKMFGDWQNLLDRLTYTEEDGWVWRK